LVSAKKFMVDLHDLYDQVSFRGKPVDHFMVKSEFHKSLGSRFPNMEVISNGI